MTIETIQTDTLQPLFDFRTWEAFEEHTHRWGKMITDHALSGCYDRNERRCVTKKFKRAVTLYLRSARSRFPDITVSQNEAMEHVTGFLNDLYQGAESVRKDGPF
jgi:hypothetical protein